MYSVLYLYGNLSPTAAQAHLVIYLPGRIRSDHSFLAITMKGSAPGLDGWSGDEIASFPYKVWEVYSELITRWMSRNDYPQQWQQARQHP